VSRRGIALLRAALKKGECVVARVIARRPMVVARERNSASPDG
jgi:hypothetical protein